MSRSAYGERRRTFPYFFLFISKLFREVWKLAGYSRTVILAKINFFCGGTFHPIQALFPAGEEMVAIIDDRPDVWDYTDALVQVWI